MKISQITERNKAEKFLRFINYILDFIAAMIVIYTIIIVYTFVKYFIFGIDIEETASSLENINPMLDRILTLIMYAFIMFLIELITKGRSLGKLITGTKVVKIDGSTLTTEDLLKRNFSRAVPFDALSFIGNNGWHDNWSDTRVVKKRSFENEKNIENEIQTIGVKENF